ncbi:MAG: hypothetical protein MZV63_11895 [Marinilabiliales bacterium]|nr:hypothetical protein [Marinilabiliales bacterium]
MKGSRKKDNHGIRMIPALFLTYLKASLFSIIYLMHPPELPVGIYRELTIVPGLSPHKRSLFYVVFKYLRQSEIRENPEISDNTPGIVNLQQSIVNILFTLNRIVAVGVGSLWL